MIKKNMSFEEFSVEFERLFKSYSANRNKTWFETAEKNHLSLRDKIGGIERERKVEVQDSEESLKLEVVRPIVSELNREFDGFASSLYGYGGESLLKTPMYTEGSHNAIKVTKIITKIANSILNNPYAEHANSVKVRKLKQVNKITAKLGELWAKSKKTKATYFVTMSTAPISFLKLGMYGVDNDSCFKPGGGNENNKFTLGKTKDTFIIVIKDSNEKIVARCWGFASSDYTIWNISNLYFDPKVTEGSIIGILNKFFEDIMEIPLYLTADKIRGSYGVYHNPYGRFSFAPVKKIPFQEIWFDINFQCSFCHVSRDDPPENQFYFVDQYICCEKCKKKNNIKNWCEYSNKYTMSILVEGYDEEGLKINIASCYATSEFEQCSCCYKYYHSSLISLESGKAACLECTDKADKPKIVVKLPRLKKEKKIEELCL